MRAGEAARRAGVNVETLRYYERRGLLPEPPRAPNGHRRTTRSGGTHLVPDRVWRWDPAARVLSGPA